MRVIEIMKNELRSEFIQISYKIKGPCPTFEEKCNHKLLQQLQKNTKYAPHGVIKNTFTNFVSSYWNTLARKQRFDIFDEKVEQVFCEEMLQPSVFVAVCPVTAASHVCSYLLKTLDASEDNIAEAKSAFVRAVRYASYDDYCKSQILYPLTERLQSEDCLKFSNMEIDFVLRVIGNDSRELDAAMEIIDKIKEGKKEEENLHINKKQNPLGSIFNEEFDSDLDWILAKMNRAENEGLVNLLSVPGGKRNFDYRERGSLLEEATKKVKTGIDYLCENLNDQKKYFHLDTTQSLDCVGTVYDIENSEEN
ncbi:MAG: hypothetical protein SFT91_03345 [Rickettsiaceae bacterium]|nr:hypothetical protein [Rickettsiaceae bacterium]